MLQTNYTNAHTDNAHCVYISGWCWKGWRWRWWQWRWWCKCHLVNVVSDASNQLHECSHRQSSLRISQDDAGKGGDDDDDDSGGKGGDDDDDGDDDVSSVFACGFWFEKMGRAFSHSILYTGWLWKGRRLLRIGNWNYLELNSFIKLVDQAAYVFRGLIEVHMGDSKVFIL